MKLPRSRAELERLPVINSVGADALAYQAELAAMKLRMEEPLNAAHAILARNEPRELQYQWIHEKLPTLSIVEMRLATDILADRLASLTTDPVGKGGEMRPAERVSYRSSAYEQGAEDELQPQIETVLTVMSLLILKVQTSDEMSSGGAEEETSALRNCLISQGVGAGLMMTSPALIPFTLAPLLAYLGVLDALHGIPVMAVGTIGLEIAGLTAWLMGADRYIATHFLQRSTMVRKAFLARFTARVAERISGLSAWRLKRALLAGTAEAATALVQKHLCARILIPAEASPVPRTRVAETEADLDEILAEDAKKEFESHR